MRKFKSSLATFSLSFTAGVIFTLLVPSLPNPLISPLDGGPLDYRPRLVASAVSPDGTLSVKVFRQRSPSYSLYVGAEMVAKVYDSQGTIVYDRIIGRDGAWDELNDAFENIEFEGEHVRISQLWGRSHVINKSELKR